ncbi:MAG: hypothetical protein CFH21_00827 [Alphaproteobacteria bacterium MarineAlpha5_Bin11]|nr:branched-chain amino acid ABC transporter permease [Pelagibacteraceae bacterium]PPR43327.1 MAG: hypothetical protein CFH21_00827 [Alphaproteobacteria bacterium MarineAlpha5_Bin11]PPR51541.1 MAG: hypothetical protein CFH20_00468 [Alphaproteobacteria bacterium MarineAlpha5_Bin10]|tara:strand:+ start:20212 stop:21582 length:1371 start_codon:yes stop_codon:yes gene_type:complete
MSDSFKSTLAFTIMALLLFAVGIFQSWSLSLTILNLCLISAIMSLGVNIQWGYAGLINIGIMGFAALGGLAAVIVSQSPVVEAWQVGGFGMIVSFFIIVFGVLIIIVIRKKIHTIMLKRFFIFLVIILMMILLNKFYHPAVSAIESVNPAKTGFLGGLGMPIIISWFIGGLLAAGVAWVIGKVTLSLRSDYLAIATLGISEIIIAILKHEDWLARGVKNVTGLPRPVPYEVNLQNTEWFINLVEKINIKSLDRIIDLSEKKDLLRSLVIESSSIFVKLCYSGLIVIVLLIILYLSNRALNSPWGRMMRAIRDNEEAANAMGKNVVKHHLRVFILGSAVVGIAGAMLTTLNGQFTPGSYQPLRFTFLIWIMVIVGGSGNNLGAVLGGFFIWFLWIEAEPISIFFMNLLTSGLSESSFLKSHLTESAPHLRLFIMGFVLLLTLRFRPKGLLPEKVRRV